MARKQQNLPRELLVAFQSPGQSPLAGADGFQLHAVAQQTVPAEQIFPPVQVGHAPGGVPRSCPGKPVAAGRGAAGEAASRTSA